MVRTQTGPTGTGKMGLDRFIQDARRRVDAGHYDTQGGPLAPNGSLLDALAVDAAVIAELKPRSPSAGRLLRGDPGDPTAAADMLAAYVAGGAAALSVLADSDHFDGSPDLVRQAHGTGLPILWKDFVVDEQQIRCAAHNGASAVLLIERCFPDTAERERLVEAAHDAGLEVLLEVHGEAEWERASDSRAGLVGVNARDLDTLEVDVPASLALVTRIAEAGRTVVALSGVRDRNDRLRAEAAGASGVLVGTHLMRAPDPVLALRALRRPLAKVCGLKRPEDVVVAAQSGADLAGFVVGTPRSPRDQSPEAAAVLVRHARRLGLVPVMVTTEPDADRVLAMARQAGVAWVQAHAADPRPLREAGLHVLWATPGGTAADALPEGIDGMVLDSPSVHGVGGSGEAHDWNVSARIVAAHTGRLSLIAGGLDASNVAEAIAQSGAWGADASSGLEVAPGVKDPEKVRAYVEAAHGQ